MILVPSYNNESCTERVLERLIDQKTTMPYRIICVNDCSRDKTGQVMDDFARKHNLSEPFFKVIHNPTRRGAMANIYNTIHEQCTDNEIVVLVDGDDFLNSNLVLERLEKEYSNPDIWLTYGQFIFFPSCDWGVCYEIKREDLLHKRVRELVYVSQHLRTFKVKLFKKIRKEDLMLNGSFFAMNADMATMIPMIEMCAPLDDHSPQHCLFIPDLLYIYNYANPISDFRVDRQLQLDLEKVIRAIPPYEPLKTLDENE